MKIVFDFCIFAKLSLLLHRKPANEGRCPRTHSGLYILIAFIDALRLTKRKLRNFSNTVKIKVSNRCLFDMTFVIPHSAHKVWYVYYAPKQHPKERTLCNKGDYLAVAPCYIGN